MAVANVEDAIGRVSPDFDAIVALVFDERVAQEIKHGPNSCLNVGPERAIAVLVEEVGEVAKAVIENDAAGYRDELIQVAAVAIAMVQGLDARGGR
jgi:NTP pyrophosphatase (non-canonical NTP hydrolase)